MTKTPQRYKVGYYSDAWGMRSSTPSLLPDPNGPVVRFDDYATLAKQRDELLAVLKEAAGGIVYLAEEAKCHQEEWANWNRRALDAIASVKGGAA